MKTSQANTELTQKTWLDLMVSICNGTEKAFLNNQDDGEEPSTTLYA